MLSYNLLISMLNTNLLVKKLLPLNPEKIILFGSYVRGNVTHNSDVDLLIIQQTEKKPSQRIADALQLVWGNVPHVEPQVLTPQEFTQAIKENRFFVTEEILKHGKIIYEKT